MKYEIKHRPSYAFLEVSLEPGETIRAKAGAMTYMTPNIEVQTRMREATFLETLGLRLLGAQSFFVNDYTASSLKACFVRIFTTMFYTLLRHRLKRARTRSLQNY